jgi:hypothetical protein
MVMRHAHVMDEGVPLGTIAEHGDEGGQHPTRDTSADESLHEGSHERLLSGLVVLPMKVSGVHDHYTLCHKK